MENEKLGVQNTQVVFIKPLQMYWNPKEDITSFELALCIPFLIRFTPVMPSEVDKNQKHFRHFEIIDPNSISVSTTDKDSTEPINISNNSTSNAVVDLENPLTKPTGL